MSREPRFVGVVTEDGRDLLPDHAAAYRQHLAQFAGQEVEIIVRRRLPVTQDQRGFWWAVLVRVFQDYTGEASALVAHFQLLRLVDWVPGEGEPSTSDAASDRDQMSDRIERASAYLSSLGLQVPDPEPDPVRRLELVRRSAA